MNRLRVARVVAVSVVLALSVDASAQGLPVPEVPPDVFAWEFSDLRVTGWAKFDSYSQFGEKVTVKKELTIEGATTASSIAVTGAAKLNGGLEVAAGNSLTARGPLVAKDTLTVDSLGTFNGGLDVATGKALTANGPVVAGETLTVAQKATFNGDVEVAAEKSLTVKGLLAADGSVTVAQKATFNGDVEVAAEKRLTVKGPLAADGSLTVGQTATLNGDVQVAGGRTLTAGGPIVAKSGLTVDLLGTFKDGVTVGSGGTLTAEGPVVAKETLSVAKGLSAAQVTTDVLMLNGRSIATSGGRLTIDGSAVSVSGGPGVVSSLEVGGASSFLGSVSVSTKAANDGIYLLGASGSGDSVRLVTNLGDGSYNPLTRAGDRGIFYSSTGGFVIAPWSEETRGLRMDAKGNVVIGQDVNSIAGYCDGPTCLGVEGPVYADRVRDNQGGWWQMDPSETSYLNSAIFTGSLSVWGNATLWGSHLYGPRIEGNVGIGAFGADSPQFPVHIKHQSASFETAGRYQYMNSADIGYGGGYVQPLSISIWADDRIVTAAEVNVMSDAREKDLVGTIEPREAAEKIRKLVPKTYTWKDKHELGVKSGFIAQEVDKVVPEAVSKLEARGFKDLHVLNYDTLYTLNVAATKHLLEIVERQQAMLVKQQSEIDELKAKVGKAKR